jgi:hypothetical protein
MSPTIGFALICLLLAALILLRIHRRPRDLTLPPPEKSTERTPDWRRYELNTPRRYIP